VGPYLREAFFDRPPSGLRATLEGQPGTPACVAAAAGGRRVGSVACPRSCPIGHGGVIVPPRGRPAGVRSEVPRHIGRTFSDVGLSPECARRSSIGCQNPNPRRQRRSPIGGSASHRWRRRCGTSPARPPDEHERADQEHQTDAQRPEPQPGVEHRDHEHSGCDRGNSSDLPAIVRVHPANVPDTGAVPASVRKR
jgi:hypothetical protein